MRQLKPVLVAIFAACIVLFVASPWGGRVTFPQVTNQTYGIEAKRFLGAGTQIDPQRDLVVTTQPITAPFGDRLTVPAGTLPGVILSQYMGYEMAKDAQAGSPLTISHIAPSATATNINSNSYVFVFQRDQKAGQAINYRDIQQQNQPYPWPFKHVIDTNSQNNSRRHNNTTRGIAQNYNGKVLAVDVKAGMPLMDSLFITQQDWQKRQAAAVPSPSPNPSVNPSPRPFYTPVEAQPPSLFASPQAQPQQQVAWKVLWTRDVPKGETIRAATAFSFVPLGTDQPQQGALLALGTSQQNDLIRDNDYRILLRDVKAGQPVMQGDLE